MRRHKLGNVLAAETGFLLERASDGRLTIRAAGVAFVAEGRVPSGAHTSRFLEIAPDLIVETLAPSDTAGCRGEDRAVASRGGEGRARREPFVPVDHRPPPGRDLRLEHDEELDLGDVISGFRSRVAEIFD